MKTVVVNKRTEAFDVYIGRGSIFGNPFPIGKHRTREQAIQAYRTYFYKLIEDSPHFKAQILRLKGKRLGCYCKPKPCHGDVIVEYLDAHDRGDVT